MTIRAKFYCNNVSKDGDANRVCFAPVYSGSEENKQFFKNTPGGDISLYVVNPSVCFEAGREYYVDFTPASSMGVDKV